MPAQPETRTTPFGDAERAFDLAEEAVAGAKGKRRQQAREALTEFARLRFRATGASGRPRLGKVARKLRDAAGPGGSMTKEARAAAREAAREIEDMAGVAGVAGGP